jgi:HEPN domain-containing protein
MRRGLIWRAPGSLARDSEQDDDVVGFHAQQAVEKALKAVVAARGLEIPAGGVGLT